MIRFPGAIWAKMRRLRAQNCRALQPAMPGRRLIGIVCFTGLRAAANGRHHQEIALHDDYVEWAKDHIATKGGETGGI